MTDRRPARTSTSLRRPKLFSILEEGYTRTQFLADLQAGVIVGIVALPYYAETNKVMAGTALRTLAALLD